MAPDTTRKWTDAQIKDQVERIKKVTTEEQKRLAQKGGNFTAITPEQITKKLKRVNSPMIVCQYCSSPTSPGGTLDYHAGIYNPDPTFTTWLFAHIWIGSGNVDPVLGSFLLNVDERFPRLTEPRSFNGLPLESHAFERISCTLNIPTGIDKTQYMLNACLMRLNWQDAGDYLDRSVMVFNVV
jgi:hypothetical protein